jgi:exosortase/archaeosortase family protein
MQKLHMVLSTLKERINTFYLLAFIPLLLLTYYHIPWPFAMIIPIYGFILLLIKKQDLLPYPPAKPVQKASGILIIITSFFVYYALVPFFPPVSFYTAANYAIYLLGLSLTLFDATALKETFSSIFLIVAATSSSFISEWLEPHLSPYITLQFARLMQVILNAFGLTATVRSLNHLPIISFPTIHGQTITAVFNWNCVGVSSVLIFSIILVILLTEEPGSLKSKITWSLVGVSGVLILNVLRVLIIFITDYFYGAEVGGKIHYVIGYTVFITWLITFLYLYSKKTSQTYMTNP